MSPGSALPERALAHRHPDLGVWPPDLAGDGFEFHYTEVTADGVDPVRLY